jgi:hypothetical protein
LPYQEQVVCLLRGAQTNRRILLTNEMAACRAVGANWMKMLILRGTTGHFDGRDWPRGALREAPALEYAKRRHYDGQVLDIAGKAYTGSPQHQLALKTYRGDKNIGALYGFSGGGYNVRHVIDDLDKAERSRLELVVVRGAPLNDASLYEGPWDLVYRRDPPPPLEHMDGPAALLAELDAPKP